MGIKNMITGASQADVAMIMVPADRNFTTAIAKGNHKAGEIQGQTRQHSRLINLLGVKQIYVGVNKMDCDVAGYKKDRYDEIANEMRNMLQKVSWWSGTDVYVGEEKLHVETVYEVLDKVCRIP